MKKILLVKGDGIGDYLFFRLFLPQLAKIQEAELYFCCSDAVLPLALAYDADYFKGIFSCRDLAKYAKDKYLLFLPKRYHRWKQTRNAWKAIRKVDMAVNVQTCRGIFSEKVMEMVKSPYKAAVCNCNLREAPQEAYRDSIYSTLLDISLDQFIFSYYQKQLEQVFHHSFTIPACKLPFSRTDILHACAEAQIPPGEYILFVPFSSAGTKNWAIENFRELAKKLSANFSYPIVLVGQCPPDMKHEWKNWPQVIDLTNQTSLVTALQIAAGAKYAVCVDTSLMHAALWGGAETIIISNGMAENLFVRYPQYCSVKQTVFMPAERDERGIGNIQQVSVQSVWQHITEHWK